MTDRAANPLARRGGVIGLAAALAGLLTAAGPAAAQVRGYPIDPSPDPPALSAAPPPPVVGSPVRPEPPDFSQSPLPSDAAVLPPVVVGFPARPDPPGCPAPTPPPVTGEPAGCGRRFCYETHSGAVFSMFPPTLLWEPPLASKHEPRFAVLGSTLTNGFTRQTTDVSIGNTVGLFRYEAAGSPVRVQLDLFAVAFARISQHDFLVESDYRAGLPITFECGPWHGKFGYEHTSTHLGDETLVRTGRQPFDYIKDELVVGLGRWLFRDSLRVYADAGWAVSQFVPGNPSPFRFDVGAEWYRRRVTGFRGQPFAATNLDFNGSVGYTPSWTLQAGWQWRDPARRLAQMRVFGEYFVGRSPYGQFFQDREQWFGIGIAADY